MAEFFNDEQKSAYLAALEREKEGYQARLERAKDDDEKLSVKRLQKRIASVDAELERVSGLGSVEETVADGSDVAKLSVAALDETYGQLEGYPLTGKKADKVAFVEAHLDEKEA
jgi:hypothetical protein